jgi:hypothetical protein
VLNQLLKSMSYRLNGGSKGESAWMKQRVFVDPTSSQCGQKGESK